MGLLCALGAGRHQDHATADPQPGTAVGLHESGDGASQPREPRFLCRPGQSDFFADRPDEVPRVPGERGNRVRRRERASTLALQPGPQQPAAPHRRRLPTDAAHGGARGMGDLLHEPGGERKRAWLQLEHSLRLVARFGANSLKRPLEPIPHRSAATAGIVARNADALGTRPELRQRGQRAQLRPPVLVRLPAPVAGEHFGRCLLCRVAHKSGAGQQGIQRAGRGRARQRQPAKRRQPELPERAVAEPVRRTDPGNGIEQRDNVEIPIVAAFPPVHRFQHRSTGRGDALVQLFSNDVREAVLARTYGNRDVHAFQEYRGR